MPLESPDIEYQRPSPHPDRWQLGRVIDWLTAGCFVAAVYCGVMSVVLSRKLATPTPAYQQFRQTMDARAATRPAGTVFEYPSFTGQAYVTRPLMSLPTTYSALGFAGAGVALFVTNPLRPRCRVSRDAERSTFFGRKTRSAPRRG